MEELTLKSFEEAAEKVKEATLPTNLVYSEYFSSQTGNRVYLKPENMQYTGAYKVRGAYYKISTMSEEARQKGLITASAGNHAVSFSLVSVSCLSAFSVLSATLFRGLQWSASSFRNRDYLAGTSAFSASEILI